MKLNVKQNIFTLALLVWSCLAAPAKAPGGKKTSNGQVSGASTAAPSAMPLGMEGGGDVLQTNELPPPPGHDEQPSYLVHGEGPFQPPPPGTLKLHVPGMQKVMVPQVTLADFDFFDQDGNGLIDSTELATGSNLPLFADNAFKMSDVDNDGFVNPDEFFQFPMTWQRVVAEVRFQKAAHGGLNFNTQPPGLAGTEETPESEGMGEMTPYDGQTGVGQAAQENSTIPEVTGGVDQMSATTAIPDMAGEEGEAELEAEGEGQVVGTTGLAGQVPIAGGMPAEEERGASEWRSITAHPPARSHGMTNGQTSRGQVGAPESQTAEENQEVEKEEAGKQEPSAGREDAQVVGPTYGEVSARYSAGQTGRYQGPGGPVVGPSDGDGGEDQGLENTRDYGVKPSHAQGYYASQYKASAYPAYPIKSKSGYVYQYAPYIKEAKPYAMGYHYSSQRRRYGDSSEEARGGGSSSDEDEDDRRK